MCAVRCAFPARLCVSVCVRLSVCPCHLTHTCRPENMMHTTSGCRSSDEEERGSCSAASVMDSGSRIGGDSRHNEVEVFNCPWRISPPQSCSRHSSGFGPGNLPCELSGRGRFSRRHSRTEGGLHLYLSAAAILLLACLVSSPEAVPIPAKAPSEVRTLETGKCDLIAVDFLDL